MQEMAFLFLGFLALIVAILVLTQKGFVAAIMLLITDFVILASMYGLLDASFLATSQIIVYAGAIMVLFVFVIMMLNLKNSTLNFQKPTFIDLFFITIGLTISIIYANKGLLGFLVEGINDTPKGYYKHLAYPPEQNIHNIAFHLFANYAWAFEILGVLLLATMVAAIVVTKTDRKSL